MLHIDRRGRCGVENFLCVESLRRVGGVVLGDKIINGNEVDICRSSEMTLQGMVRRKWRR